MSRRKRISAILLTIGLAFSLTSSAFASQETQDVSGASSQSIVTDSEIKDLKANFTQLGIDEATQQILIQKLKDGKEIDAMNSEKANEGITTVTRHLATKTSDTSITGFSARTVYPDGSVSVLSVTPGPGTVCGSGYCNVRDAVVEQGNGVVTASFLADYTLVDGGYGSISKAYQPKVKVWGGEYSDLNGPNIVRPTETYYQSARASLSWKYKGGAGVSTQYLHLDVQDNKATSSVS